MTNQAPQAGDSTNITLKNCIDVEKVGAFLSDIFNAWERGRNPLENTVTAREEEWKKIVHRTYEFCGMIAAGVIGEAGGQLAAAAAKNVAQAAFSEGLAKGKALGALKPSGKPAALPSALPQMDSQAIVKTIGGELRKMFEAGLEQGKEAAAGTGEAGKLEKPSGEIVRVQRNAAGEIIGAVKEFTYPVAPGGV